MRRNIKALRLSKLNHVEKRAKKQNNIARKITVIIRSRSFNCILSRIERPIQYTPVLLTINFSSMERLEHPYMHKNPHNSFSAIIRLLAHGEIFKILIILNLPSFIIVQWIEKPKKMTLTTHVPDGSITSQRLIAVATMTFSTASRPFPSPPRIWSKFDSKG